MLQQSDSLLIDELSDHVRQNRTDSVEPLVGLTYVLQAHVVQEDLLNNEYRDRLAEFRTGLHDTKAKWNDLGSQKEVDDLGAVVLDQRTNDAEGGKAQVLEWARFGGRVEKGVQEERDVGCISLVQSRHESGTPFIPLRKSPRVSPCEATH